MNKGWIKLHRKLLENPIWMKHRKFSQAEAWIDLLLNVQFEDEPQQVIIGNTVLYCNRGESLKSLITWAKRWGWSEAKVRRVFLLFQNCNMIVSKSEGITTRITICNYDVYNETRRTIDGQSTGNRRAIDDRQEYKELKNVKNNNIYGVLTNPGLVDDSVVKTNTVFYELKNNINNLYRRKETTKWANKETNKLKEISKRQDAMQEFNQIKELYESGYKYRRKDIITLLNNWTGELDRAVGKKPMPKKYGI